MSALGMNVNGGGGYTDAHPTDDEMFKRRYVAIQDVINELEDENNLIAYRIAKLRKERKEKEQQALERERKLATAAKAEAEKKKREIIDVDELEEEGRVINVEDTEPRSSIPPEPAVLESSPAPHARQNGDGDGAENGGRSPRVEEEEDVEMDDY